MNDELVSVLNDYFEIVKQVQCKNPNDELSGIGVLLIANLFMLCMKYAIPLPVVCTTSDGGEIEVEWLGKWYVILLADDDGLTMGIIPFPENEDYASTSPDNITLYPNNLTGTMELLIAIQDYLLED